MTNYIVYKPFQIHNGELLPTGASIFCDGEKAFYNNKFICLIHSAHSQECLVGNDDKRGMERGKLIEEINDLVNNESDLGIRCDRVTALWEDNTARKYVRYNDPSNPWLWNDIYFCADIDDLEHIKNIISGKE